MNPNLKKIVVTIDYTVGGSPDDATTIKKIRRQYVLTTYVSAIS